MLVPEQKAYQRASLPFLTDADELIRQRALHTSKREKPEKKTKMSSKTAIPNTLIIWNILMNQVIVGTAGVVAMLTTLNLGSWMTKTLLINTMPLQTMITFCEGVLQPIQGRR